MNLLTGLQRRTLSSLAHVVTPQHGVPRPQSHMLGADHVAILLVAVMLTDLGGACITAVTITPFAGQSRSTVGKKLATLSSRKWLEVTSEHCPLGLCAGRTKHYRPTD